MYSNEKIIKINIIIKSIYSVFQKVTYKYLEPIFFDHQMNIS